MYKYKININYSWGDEEEPIEFEAKNTYDAFCRVIDMAMEESKISLGCNEDADFDIYIKPSEQKVILHYGYDDEECYYELEEI